MSLFDLFSPAPREATNLGSRRSTANRSQPDRDVGIERFVTFPGDEPAEVVAAGIATSDLTQ